MPLPPGFVADPKPTLPPGFVPDTADARPADFQIDNAKDDDGNPLVTFASHALQQVNPIPLGQMIPFPKALGGAGLDAPLQAGKQILEAHKHVFERAAEAAKQGNYGEAAIHALNWLLPVIGPVLDQAGNELRSGKVAAGLGDTLGLAAGLVGPKALELRGAAVPKAAAAEEPTAAAEAVKFGQAQGIPVDAGTVTGNRAVKAVQHLADRSLAGSVVAQGAEKAANAALTKTGEGLAARVHPEAVTAEQAGVGVQGALGWLMRTLHEQANTAYGKLRDIESTTTGEVAAPIEVTPAMKARMTSTLGKVPAPTQTELQEMRNVAEELRAVPYQRGKLVDERPGVTSDQHYAVGSGNAPAYHDILQLAPGTSKMTGIQMRDSIEAALETGLFNNAARGALAVARERLAGTNRVGGAMLVKPGEGTVTTSMALPVDVRDVKTAVRPLYDQLKRESDLVPLMGGKAQTLVALDRLINAPDHAPLSVADGALSDLKAMARADDPILRSVAQGRAAYAVSKLDAAVRKAATAAGPEAINALEEGRAATSAKYATAAIADTLNAEPVRAFRQLTAPKDSAIAQLRQVSDHAPAEMPKIGRALLEDMLSKATEAGGFDHAAKLYADWQKLGPQTKQVLFGPVTSDLDKFFLLAKRMAENPNPSGTAHTVGLYAQAAGFANPATFFPSLLAQTGAAGLSALLHSPRGVQMVTRLLGMSKAPDAAKASLLGQVLKAAKEATAAGMQARPGVLNAARTAGAERPQ